MLNGVFKDQALWYGYNANITLADTTSRLVLILHDD